MNFQRKASQVDIKQEGDRTLRVRAYGTGVDRDGETIAPEAWKTERFLANPTVLFGHDYHGLPVARATSITAGKDGLDEVWLFPTEEESGAHFAFTDSIFRMARSGFLRGVSVGFIPIEWEDHPLADGRKEPRRTYTAVELLETSIVPIGSDPTALVAGFESGQLKAGDVPVLKAILRDLTSGTDGLKAVQWAEEIEKALPRITQETPPPPATPDPVLAEIREDTQNILKRLRTLEARFGARLPAADLRFAKHLLEKVIALGDEPRHAPAVAVPAPGEDAEALALRMLRSLRKDGK